MPRPKSQTVDYFPHDCNHRKTMFIIEETWGNDGYAFWFKLLEMIGATEGHFIDCRNPATWRFLQAKTHLSEDTCRSMLDMLAELESIDPELWKQNIIWSQHFVDRISNVYANRRVETPTKPDNYRQESHGVDVSTEESTQSRVKESRVKEKRKQSQNDSTSPPNNHKPKITQKFCSKILETWNTNRGVFPELKKRMLLDNDRNRKRIALIMAYMEYDEVQFLEDIRHCAIKAQQIGWIVEKGGFSFNKLVDNKSAWDRWHNHISGETPDQIAAQETDEKLDRKAFRTAKEMQEEYDRKFMEGLD